jgi:hypothetical protein
MGTEGVEVERDDVPTGGVGARNTLDRGVKEQWDVKTPRDQAASRQYVPVRSLYRAGVDSVPDSRPAGDQTALSQQAKGQECAALGKLRPSLAETRKCRRPVCYPEEGAEGAYAIVVR